MDKNTQCVNQAWPKPRYGHFINMPISVTSISCQFQATLKNLMVADILACLLNLNFKQRKVTRISFYHV
jgi:hypothetical protein